MTSSKGRAYMGGVQNPLKPTEIRSSSGLCTQLATRPAPLEEQMALRLYKQLWRQHGLKGDGPGYAERKRQRLDQLAAEMREHNLTHGTGCKSRARAIEARQMRTKA